MDSRQRRRGIVCTTSVTFCDSETCKIKRVLLLELRKRKRNRRRKRKRERRGGGGGEEREEGGGGGEEASSAPFPLNTYTPLQALTMRFYSVKQDVSNLIVP